jgi:RNA polymerase sigma-70 factor (ECF subfamily)
MTGAQLTSRPLTECLTGGRIGRLCRIRKKGADVPEQDPLVREQRSGLVSAPQDDAELASRTAKGDESAYAVLVRRHLPRVMAVSRRMLGNDALAEEAAQEAMLRLWTHAGSYAAEKARLTTWLTRIAVNICLDRLRKRQEDPWPEEFDVALPAGQDHQLMEDQVAAKVNAALQQLPERQRLALVLCHYEDMSMTEAAAIMETTQEAIESLLARGRRSLKRLLESEWRMLLGEDDAA